MSFLKKFQKTRKTSESGSIGSSLSIQSIGTNKGLLNTTYSVNEKELPSFLKAIWRNNVPKVKKLMKKNYNVVDKERRSGLHLACAMGSVELVRELLGNFCNELLEKKDINGRTGLFKAVEAGSIECVRLLIEKGAKIEVRDECGDNIVHAAIKHKHLETLQYLLEVHCNSSQPNNEGQAPIHLAASMDYIDGIIILLQHHVDIDQLNSSGKSALILAAESGNYNAIKELLSRNADMTITDIDGKDALYYSDFHQYTDCTQQLKSVNEYIKRVTPPRKSIPLQMPEFIVSQSPVSRIVSSDSKQLSTVPAPDEYYDHKTEDIETRDIKKQSPKKNNRSGSLKSENSWSEDFSHYSSDTTLPNIKSTRMNDISTPSSMPNPSEDSSHRGRQIPKISAVSQTAKQHSDDEESQWTDSESNNVPIKHIKNNLGSQVPKVKEEEIVKIAKNDDSDWDSNTENDKDGVLSTIDEESAGKQKMKIQKTKMKMHDGHQTDSNIEDCYNSNYIFLNKPVKYDSSETLEKSIDYDDDDTELSLTKIPNPNYKEEVSAPFTKPPVSPMNKGDNVPVITIDDASFKGKVAKNTNGDNLSYASTDLSSQRGSLTGSDQADFDKINSKSTEDYIRKCSSMESKMRIIESEKDILQQDIKRTNESKRKSEMEKAKLQKDYQKLEITLSEKKDEMEEFKSKFIITEDLLKTREKDSFELKKSNQELIGRLNETELKNIAYDSKIKQLQQEITSLQTELQKSSHSDKDSEYQKSQYETDRDMWLKKNEELNAQLSEQQQRLNKLQKDTDGIIAEQKSTINTCQDQIRELSKSLENNKADDLNRVEEIEQLKKTIHNLNADLESSNKSAALAAKEEQKNKNLIDQIKTEESKVSELRNEIQMLKKQMLDAEQSHHKTKQEIERQRNQIEVKDESISQLELKCKSSKSQAMDLEKLLETKISEVKELNKKCNDLDENLISERNTKDSIVEKVNLAINSAISQCPDSEEVLEQLRSIRKLLNGSEPSHRSNLEAQTSNSYQELDSSIELSKAKSQIRVLQDQLEEARRDLKLSQDEHFTPKKSVQFQCNDYESEMDRVNRIERMEKENQHELNDQTQLLRKTQQQMEIGEMTQMLTRAEKDRDELIQEIKSISEQLIKERNLKDTLTEQLVNVFRNPNGSIQQMSGSKEFLFPLAAETMNTTSSQWNIPNNNSSVGDRKPFSTSMSNLSLLKCTGIEDEELRQRMRKELDRSITKHLESGRPIRQLNVKDKIRSLNVVRYPSNGVAWKAQ